MVDEVRQITLLPPRKRLLAGMKIRDASTSNSANPIVSNEATETSRLAALAAARAASAARALALEKAEVAVRARDFARRVLKLVGSVLGEKETSVEKSVAVELLYNSNSRFEGTRKAKLDKKRDLNGVMVCDVNTALRYSGHSPRGNGNSEPNNDEKGVVKCKVGWPGKALGVKNCSRPRIGCNVKREVVVYKRGRIKPKKLLLSQCCRKDSKASGVVLNPVDGKFAMVATSVVSESDVKASDEGELAAKSDSGRNPKKLKKDLGVKSYSRGRIGCNVKREVIMYKRGRIKPKKLLLSQCSRKDTLASGVVLNPLDGKFALVARSVMSLPETESDVKASDEGELAAEAESGRKPKKLKVSQFYEK